MLYIKLVSVDNYLPGEIWQLCKAHRISIPAYAIEQQWWQLGVSKNEMSLMSFIFKMMLVIYFGVRVNKWLYFKYLLTRQQMVFHLFFALTVSIRSWVLFPTPCGSINTKTMVKPDVKLNVRTTAWQVSLNCQIFQINPVL
jgi:hypothetical protein